VFRRGCDTLRAQKAKGPCNVQEQLLTILKDDFFFSYRATEKCNYFTSKPTDPKLLKGGACLLHFILYIYTYIYIRFYSTIFFFCFMELVNSQVNFKIFCLIVLKSML